MLTDDIFALEGKAKEINDLFELFSHQHRWNDNYQFDKDGKAVEQWRLHSEGDNIVIHVDFLAPSGMKLLGDFMAELVKAGLIEDKPLGDFLLEDEGEYVRLLAYLPIKE